jgi:protein involved in polysaccharide export with SLBB domain
MPTLTVGTTPVAVLGRDANRQTCSFANEGSTYIYLQPAEPSGLVAAIANYRLAPGDTLDFSLLVDGRDITQPWSAISDAAGGTLRHAEMAVGV